MLPHLYQPLLLRIDFSDQGWRVSPLHARAWLLLALAADLSVMWVGNSPLLSLCLAPLATLGFWWCGPTLALGGAGLYLGQSLGSLGLVLLGLNGTLSELTVGIATLCWQVFTLVAFIRLVLAYLRYPKRLIGTKKAN